MQFVIDVVTRFSGRLGHYVCSETSQTFQTPLLLQTTKSGNIPYLPYEVFKYVVNDPQVLEISLDTVDHMEEAVNAYQHGLASFVGYPEFLTFVTLRNPCVLSPPGFHVKDAFSLFTRRGKRDLTADSFMNIIESLQPNIYHALCDGDTDIHSSKKRIIKSVNRTKKFFLSCLERHRNSKNLRNSLFFGPVVGGYNKNARLQSIEILSKYPEVDGYIIEGLHYNGEPTIKLNHELLQDILSYCMKRLRPDKPKMTLGAFPPLTVLKLIQTGVDIFDSSYVYTVSTAYNGFVFNYNLDTKKRSKALTINLNNDSFSDDFRPILDECSCLCCQKHTRAYINHLVKTKELLGMMLIMLHNMHHYVKFFEAIRKSIVEDKLPDLIVLVEGCAEEN